MNSRERFLRTMRFEKVDRALLWEFGYWAKTIRKWYIEKLPEIRGIPAEIEDGMTVTGEGIPSPEGDSPFAEDVSSYLKFDKGLTRIPVELGLFPLLKERVLEENNKTFIVKTTWGATKEIYKDGSSVPRFLSFPLSDDSSFKKLKEKFDPNDPGRFPKDWKGLCKKYEKRDYPIILGGHPYGIFGTLRYLMGFENFMINFHDDPKLIKKIFDFLSDFWIEMYKKVLQDIKPDCVFFWEDMSYKNGSFVSPEIFRKFFKPTYKKITNFVNDNGIDLVAVDTDGNCDELIPLFIESGINIIWPFEVQSGMNIVNVRKKFPRLGIAGGLNKIIISHDKKSIDEEIVGKLPFMLSKGGYIPYSDHLIPPEVSFNKFIYYRKKINEIVTGYKY